MVTTCATWTPTGVCCLTRSRYGHREGRPRSGCACRGYSPSLDDIQEELTVSAWVLREQSPPGWRIALAKAVGSEHLEIVDPPAPDGVWQHLAGTHDGRHERRYVDGVELGASACG